MRCVPMPTPTRVLHLCRPDEQILARVLEDELKRNFMQADVKWVDCPDLTKEPFNLAAPGLCGKTALLDFGNLSYLNSYVSYPTMERIYDIKMFLKHIDRDSSDSFIFGSGITQRPSNGKLGEFVMNKRFSTMNVYNNKSHVIFINQEQRKCDVEMLSDSHFECNVQGTFFLSEGLQTAETAPILQVRAKRYRENKYPGFIHLMKNALQKYYGTAQPLIVLGGVHVSYNQIWTHELKSYIWEEAPFNVRRMSCEVEEPTAIISIFNNSVQNIPRNVNFSQLSRCLFHHSANGYHYLHTASNKDEEFLGYFYPADIIYRIDT